MKALYIKEPNKISWEDINIPEQVNPQEVLIKVKAAGICGTDVHIYDGSHGAVKYPIIPGHELVGKIVKKGKEVTDKKVGDRIAVDPVVSCGECSVCLADRHNICQSVKCLGVQTEGGFREYMKVNSERVYTFSDSLDWEVAVLTEPFSIATQISERLRINSEDKVLIIGAGTIGLSLVQVIGKIYGAEIIIADIIENKLDFTRSFSVKEAINSREENEVKKAIEIWEKKGPTVIIDAVGNNSVLENAVLESIPGCRIGNIGFMNDPISIPPVEITKKELELIGSRMNNKKFPQVLQWFDDGILEPKKLITHKFDFVEAEQAFATMKNDKELTCKIILDMNG